MPTPVACPAPSPPAPTPQPATVPVPAAASAPEPEPAACPVCPTVPAPSPCPDPAPSPTPSTSTYQLPHVDLVIALDVTSSMTRQVAALKAEVGQLSDLLSRMAPSFGISLVAFGDRQWERPTTTFPLRTISGPTLNRAAFRGFGVGADSVPYLEPAHRPRFPIPRASTGSAGGPHPGGTLLFQLHHAGDG